MKTILQAISMTFLGSMLAWPAMARGDLSVVLQGPYQLASPDAILKSFNPTPKTEKPSDDGSRGSSPSIVGLWKVQLISKGNTHHNTPILDGALTDFGYTQWHSDGTEILNSAGHAAATGNFCLGVWAQTGSRTYELNHLPVSYDPTTGAIVNFIILKEQDTLSPSGNSYTGTFTTTIYDPKGNQVDQIVGVVVGTRLTVDSTFPSALPNS